MTITIIVMMMTLKKPILILAANTIQHHRGPWKTCKKSSVKAPVSACHVTCSNTWNVNSFPDISDINRTRTAKNCDDRPTVATPAGRWMELFFVAAAWRRGVSRVMWTCGHGIVFYLCSFRCIFCKYITPISSSVINSKHRPIKYRH